MNTYRGSFCASGATQPHTPPLARSLSSSGSRNPLDSAQTRPPRPSAPSPHRRQTRRTRTENRPTTQPTPHKPSPPQPPTPTHRQRRTKQPQIRRPRKYFNVNCDVKFGAFLQVLHVLPVPGSERIQDGSYGPKSVGVPLGEHFPQRIFNSDHFKLW